MLLKGSVGATFILYKNSSTPEPVLLERRESISSKKITDGAYALARVNKVLSNFSLSPIHLETKLDAEILKNLQLHSVATAFANKVFPLPGGP